MYTAMPIQIDQLGGLGSGTHSAFDHGVTCTGECNDATVMIYIAGTVENMRTRNRGDRELQGIDADRIAAFGEVRNTLD
jgi:hypothetical protein